MSETDTTTVDPWYMTGTEGTGEYRVIAMNEAGKLGFRLLEDDTVRVRIEVTNESQDELGTTFTVTGGWKQPDYTQQRFSQVLPKGNEAINMIVEALMALKKCGGKLTRNRAQYYWRKHVTA